MSYATIDELFARYALGSVVGSGYQLVTSVNVSSVHIFGAEGIVDSFLARRYKVPVPANPLITQITADLAIFNILVEHLPQVPDFMQPRYDRAMKLLMMIASGTIVVASATVISEGTTDQEAWSSTMNHHPVFSPVLSVEDQAPDSDRVAEDKDARGIDYECP